jgi:AraC family transcriptional regulator of adaptative response/methylated-DNA-[protein]-cysteine methyltransferase
MRRDRGQDGAFVYAVTTTGIYCRPSCPSRRPRPERMRFFSAPAAAEAAGFRACQRCRPTGTAAADPALELARKASRMIDEQVEEGRPTLDGLGAALGVSPGHLQRQFKRATGLSPRQYAEARRAGRVKAELAEGAQVADALYGAGYGSSSRLYEKSDRELGMTPATWRRGGAGERVDFTVVPSKLGRLLVAATDRGVCQILLGDDDRTLEAELRQALPAARIGRDSGRLGPWVERAVAYLAGREPHLDLPLDLRATAFQRQVWEALRAIPRGETRSYAEIAQAIGRPKAVRAVGTACGSNPVAVVVPCHRVTRGDGDLGGYRWGPERKAKLLAMEARPPKAKAG